PPGVGGPLPGVFGPGAELQSQGKLIDYLEASRGNTRFLLAVPSSMAASPITIQTGQPVMAMGGFSGGDPILTTEQVAEDVADGTVRFFLLSGQRSSADGGGVGSGAAAAPPIGPDDGAGLGPNPSFGAAPAGGPPGPFGRNSAAEQWITANCTPVPSGEWQQ